MQMTIKWFKESQDIDLPLADGNMHFFLSICIVVIVCRAIMNGKSSKREDSVQVMYRY